MKAAFAEMATRYAAIGDLRGGGVLLGLELVTDRERKTPANEWRRRSSAGASRRPHPAAPGRGPARKNVLRLVPPMTTTEVEIDRALAILDQAFAGAGGLPTRVGLKSARPTPAR